MGRASEGVESLRAAAETGFPCYPLFARDSNLDPIRHEKQSDSLRKGRFAKAWLKREMRGDHSHDRIAAEHNSHARPSGEIHQRL